MTRTEIVVPDLLVQRNRPVGHGGFDLLAMIVAAPDLKLLDSVITERQGELTTPACQAYARENAAHVDAWFTRSGYRSPLTGQLGSSAEGRPLRGPAPVRALLYCELSNGVLMGVQDADAVQGEVRVEYAEAGREFQGFRSRVTCGEGEPILKDDEDVFASVFQGPDTRTGITRGTERLLFFVFDAPGLSAERFERSVETVESVLGQAQGAPVTRRAELV